MSQELLHHFQSKRPSIDERIAAGNKLREKFPRINQGHHHPGHVKAALTSQVGFLFRRADP